MAGTKLRTLGIVSALGVVSSCNRDACKDEPPFEWPPEPNPGADDPPTVIGGQWLDERTLELQFSAPLSPLGTIDTRRFAILGWNAYVSSYAYFKFGRERCYVGSFYVGLLGGREIDESIAFAWVDEEQPMRLLLGLRMPDHCVVEPGPGGSGVMLVYTDANLDGSEALLDHHGDRMADIGPQWAIELLEQCLYEDGWRCRYMVYSHDEHLPNISSLAPIPCPT